MSGQPEISVVIPTYNRADYVGKAIASLCAQTLDRDRFEVIVIDDGSKDDTGEVCRASADRVNLRYHRQENSSSAVAKNTGLFFAAAPIVMFFDDDDVAHEAMLAEHLKGHEKYPDERVCILGFTDWHHSLELTPVMDYLVNIGQFLFSYVSLQREQALDWTYFWTGRISCKRRFLSHYGVFTQRMRRVEDVELGWRLGQHGLEVRYWPDAISYMLRPITFDQFCARAEGDGTSLAVFAKLHPSDAVMDYCHRDAEAKWAEREAQLAPAIAGVKAIEELLAAGAGPDEEEVLKQALYALYRRCFYSFALKGVVRGLQTMDKG